jgi:Uma2 family endonuclease
MLQTKKRLYNVEEYFALEEKGEYKSEYFYGEIFAMAGGTPNHNRITINLAGLLNAAFDESPCEAFTSDLRVQIDKDKHYSYPDVIVVCGDLEFSGGRQDTITNPILIVEVLSDSTRDYDRGSKFTAYRTIKTLRDYILIEQDSVHIEYFSREDDGTWRLHEYVSLEDTLVLESIQCSLPLRAIYQRVTFASPVHLFRTTK